MYITVVLEFIHRRIVLHSYCFGNLSYVHLQVGIENLCLPGGFNTGQVWSGGTRDSNSRPPTGHLKTKAEQIPNRRFKKLGWCSEVKQSRYTPWRRLGGEEVYLLLIHDLGTRWGWVVSVTPRSRFTPGERTPGTHWTGGWVGPRAGLDKEDRGKLLCPCRGSKPDRSVVQPVVRHYTTRAIPAPWMM
jgi:hypothetical protein